MTPEQTDKLLKASYFFSAIAAAKDSGLLAVELDLDAATAASLSTACLQAHLDSKEPHVFMEAAE